MRVDISDDCATYRAAIHSWVSWNAWCRVMAQKSRLPKLEGSSLFKQHATFQVVSSWTLPAVSGHTACFHVPLELDVSLCVCNLGSRDALGMPSRVDEGQTRGWLSVRSWSSGSGQNGFALTTKSRSQRTCRSPAQQGGQDTESYWRISRSTYCITTGVKIERACCSWRRTRQSDTGSLQSQIALMHLGIWRPYGFCDDPVKSDSAMSTFSNLVLASCWYYLYVQSVLSLSAL